MSIQEIKARLHQIIDDSEDPKLLEQLIRVLKAEQLEKQTLDSLTPKQRERIEKSIAQAMYPEQCIPHSIVKEEAAKWGKQK